MTILSRWLVGCVACATFLQGCSDSSDVPSKDLVDPVIVKAESEAIEVNVEQQEAWNNLDADGEAAVNHYPFFRISSGSLIAFETYESYRDIVEAFSLPNLVVTEWDHTTWDELEVVQSSPIKVHLTGRFSRVDRDGDSYLSTETLRVVTKEKDQWGIKIRATYPLGAPDETNTTSEDEIAAAESAAMKLLENYIEARNDRDSAALSGLHHYPGLVLQGADLHRFNTPEEYIVYEENTVIHDLDYAEWDHSTLEEVDVIKSGIDMVHLALECDDINTAGESCGSGEEGMWVITKVGDKWGIHARSLF